VLWLAGVSLLIAVNTLIDLTLYGELLLASMTIVIIGAGMLLAPPGGMVSAGLISLFEIGLLILYPELASPGTVIASVLVNFLLAFITAKAYRDQRDLRQATDHLQAIIEHSPDGIVLVDDTGELVQANPASLNLLGPRLTALDRDSLLALILPESRASFSNALLKARSGAGPVTVDLLLKRADDSPFDASVSLIQIPAQGLLITLRDVSALKEADRMKDAFVDNVSHELKTPITAIKLHLHLIGQNPVKAEHYLDILRREADRLARMVDDVLMLSRLEQGKGQRQVVGFDLSDGLRHLADTFQGLASERDITLVTTLPESPLPIVGEESLLLQAAGNLINNALNYTPAGGRVGITIARRPAADDGHEWLGIQIADNGPEVRPEDRERILERFVRGPAEQTASVPGTGLGLAITRQIVNRHQGELEVASTGVPGEGSIFTIWLPAPALEDASQEAG
jgi:two-component system phosphate regulon sensor histidine kinase PhoR